jgi:Beta protein
MDVIEMQSALYFPFIRGRAGEIEAIGRLSPLARARIALVVDLPVKELGALETIDEYVGGFISDIASAWGPSHPIFLDLNRYGPEHLDRLGRPIIEHLFDCARQKKLKAVPVAGTDRGPGSSYNEAVARIANRDQRGAALRLPYEDFSDGATLEQVLESALETLKIAPEQLDVFLDAGSLPAMPLEQAEEDHLHATVLQALLLLGRYRFRNIVFAGSSVPESLRATADGSPREIIRVELRVWRRLIANNKTPLVLFGDTGIWSPRQLDIGGGGGPPPARVRIPILDRQIFYRNEPSRYRDCCREALRIPEIAALPRCWGLDAIRSVERGTAGPEAATTWVARDTNTHIEVTSRLVEQDLRQQRRLEAVSLTPLQAEPWSQEALALQERH